MQDMTKMPQGITPCGARNRSPEGTSLKKWETIEMVRPINTRAGRATAVGRMSLFRGRPTPHSFRLFSLSKRYHTRTSEGILYAMIRAISAVAENSTASPDITDPAEIRKKRTAYNINGSINALIKAFLLA
jgi:hypothetical protein